MNQEKANTADNRFHDEMNKTISEFYGVTTNASGWVGVNNDLINFFIEKSVDDNEAFSDKYVKKVIFMMNLQNLFLVQLKETWDLYRKHAGIE